MSMTRMLIGRRRTSPSRPVSGRPTAAHPVVSERGRSPGNDPRRAGHPDPVVLGPLDEQGPAGDVAAVRRTAFGTVHQRRRPHHCPGTPAAPPGPPPPPLLPPDPHAPPPHPPAPP